MLRDYKHSENNRSSNFQKFSDGEESIEMEPGIYFNLPFVLLFVE
jgi:hypothetical protein